MDWDAVVETNRAALKRIVAALVAMAGLSLCAAGLSRSGREAGLAGPAHLPRRLHRAVLRLLRPAESAARRLVIVAARGLADPVLPPLGKPRPLVRSAILRNGIGTGIVMPPAPPAAARNAVRKLALPLFDPLPRLQARRAPAVKRGVPRLSAPGFGTPFAIPARHAPAPDDPVGTARLVLRFRALVSALDDLPGQARRFARWRSRVAARAASPGPARRFARVSALRGGRPPGGLRKPAHAVHELLAELNGLAVWALERPDTS